MILYITNCYTVLLELGESIQCIINQCTGENVTIKSGVHIGSLIILPVFKQHM